MKQKPKNKNIKKRSPKKSSKRTSKAVVLAYAKHLGLRHLRLVQHGHTGKLIHHRHTSHLALIVILLIVGLFLLASESISRALQITSVGTVSISAVVPGTAPVIGATITSPTDGTKLVDLDAVEIMGVCAKGTFVVIKNNGNLVGSTLCTDAGIFVLQIQLQSGENILSALNYDNLNQSGPSTPSVTIYVTKTIKTEEVVAPTLPDNPSIIPGVGPDISGCDIYKLADLSVGGEVRIAVVCIPRLFESGQQQTLGFLVWGGSPPYAINIDWGDGSEDTLSSLPTQVYKTETFSYENAGVYNITFRLKDKDGKTAIVQTAVQVTGKAKTFFATLTDDILYKSWFDTPVPFYLMAVAVTLGFWGGDIFDRKYGAKKFRAHTRRAV